MVKSRKHHVLEMLAEAGERGRADDAFVSQFTPELLDLAAGEFVTVEREVKMVRGRPRDFARLRITAKGRKLIENRAVLGHGELTSPARPAQNVAA